MRERKRQRETDTERVLGFLVTSKLRSLFYAIIVKNFTIISSNGCDLYLPKKHYMKEMLTQ